MDPGIVDGIITTACGVWETKEVRKSLSLSLEHVTVGAETLNIIISINFMFVLELAQRDSARACL